jgi:serine/threonine-protein kinase HipA
MIERGGRFTLGDGKEEWIVKPHHPTHPNVPANEHTMMRLAAAAGIQTPKIRSGHRQGDGDNRPERVAWNYSGNRPTGG